MRAFAAEFDFVYRALRRHGVLAHDAEDLAQEVFLVMWRRWADFDGGRPLRPWLAGIAYRVAHDHIKRRWREVPGGDLDLEVDRAPQGEDRLAASHARALVLRALTSLPEKHRAMIVMHDIDGLSVQQIAAADRAPLSTAYTRIRRARLAFAEAVRRLQSAPQAALAVPLVPEALLELERAAPPAAPAGVRARVVHRLEALAPLAASRELTRSPSPAATGAALPAAAELGLIALLGVVLLAGVVQPLAQLGSAALAAPAAVPGPAPASATSSPARSPSPPAITAAAALAGPRPGPAGAALARGLVGYWRFDDGPSSAWARDMSGLGNDCVLHGLDAASAWIDGPTGGALELAGRGWLECPQPELPSGDPPAMSIALWVKRSQFRRGANVALVTREMNPAHDDYFFLGFDGYKLKATGRAWLGWTSSSLPDVTGRWVHLAFTHASDGATRLYVDGVEVARRQVGHRQLVGGRAPLMVGAGYGSFDRQVRQHFDGAIDELGLYDRALSDDEVAALASGAQPRLSL